MVLIDRRFAPSARASFRSLLVRAWSVLLLLPLLCLIACKHSPPSADMLVASLLDALPSTPPGVTLTTSADEGSPDALSPELVASLWGGGSYPSAMSGVSDAAVFLGYSPAPRELAIFICESRSDAEDMAEACRRRTSLQSLDGVESSVLIVRERIVLSIIGFPEGAVTEALYRLI